MAKRKKKEISNVELDQLLRELKMHRAKWNYFIVADGSGTTMDTACGWGGVMIARAGWRKQFSGSLSHGTNVISEIMAFLHPLMWIVRQKKRPRPVYVHVLTDCQIVKTCGQHKVSRRANQDLWFMLDAIQRQGVVVTFHWKPRKTTMLNHYADRLANYARLSLQDGETAALTVMPEGIESIYDLNPMPEDAEEE